MHSLTAELARYKEQVELYERRAKFELNEREQKIEEQIRIIITDRNIKEENLKKELHSAKMQLNSTINHNKSMVEEVKSLKTNFQQKENKYLEEFLDMKALKEKAKSANLNRAMTVYHPNTPEKLVPKVLPLKSQVQGFAAALAVLVTGASQSRQNGKSESVSYYLSD
ncbi:hypothetical protein Tco_0666605 [Tanacetum coccineum]